ncbi:alpha-L-fucosidase [Bryocella elongata]|uniref:alpha-L-fucosidase n=1 Tax=Bryocella elongata TaxID=863522 RepID=A0A1H5US81_9BACT|nr:alpha-L-fucosidase [Bryocella elongata]SEF77291.1 alpha-L-fucosidase [Bryocella elongata]
MQYATKTAQALALCLCLMSACSTPAQNFVDLKPTPQQSAWQDREFGVILHFGTNTFLDREWGDGTADPKVFNPTEFNPDQWMQAIKASGATYVVFVAKHHDGFALWPTAESDYSVKASPWRNGKGDVVGDVARAARRAGLGFGIYVSPWDRHEPRYKDQAAYDTYYRAQITELASRYGELTEWWLDGAGSAGHTYDFSKYLETLRTYQPNTIVFADTGLFEFGDARWGGDESGKIDYENWNVIDRHGQLRWRPIEVDTPLRKLHWFWHPHDESSLKSIPELMDSYEHSVGHGGQWMIGVAPDNRGLLPDSDVRRLQELGAAISARYGAQGNLAAHAVNADSNAMRAFDNDGATFWSAPEGSHAATLELRLPRPATVDRALTMEWLAEGQNVQRYRIEAMIDGRWKTLTEAQAIGHKKIDIFTPVTSSRFRLHILTSTGVARIREFQIFEEREKS